MKVQKTETDSKLNYFNTSNNIKIDIDNYDWNLFHLIKENYKNLFFQNIIYMMEVIFEHKTEIRYDSYEENFVFTNKYYVQKSPFFNDFIEKDNFSNKDILVIPLKKKMEFYKILNTVLNPTFGGFNSIRKRCSNLIT